MLRTSAYVCCDTLKVSRRDELSENVSRQHSPSCAELLRPPARSSLAESERFTLLNSEIAVRDGSTKVYAALAGDSNPFVPHLHLADVKLTNCSGYRQSQGCYERATQDILSPSAVSSVASTDPHIP
jgi:hypothetical protein